MSINCKLVIFAILLLNVALQLKAIAVERIIGGVEIPIYHVPHQVSLQYLNLHICGGTIISKKIIITAAHCVQEVDRPDLYSIRAGSTQHSSGGVLYAVQQIQPFEQYNKPFKQNHDIALLRLRTDLQLTWLIQPIRMSSIDFNGNYPGFRYYISGWGLTSKQSTELAQNLQFTYVNLVSWQLCQSLYQNKTTVTPNMLCAGIGSGGRDTCQGDSGGPLTAVAPNGDLLLVGIVSRGFDCGLELTPGIYTKVLAYRAWIESTALRLSFGV